MQEYAMLQPIADGCDAIEPKKPFAFDCPLQFDCNDNYGNTRQDGPGGNQRDEDQERNRRLRIDKPDKERCTFTPQQELLARDMGGRRRPQTVCYNTKYSITSI